MTATRIAFVGFGEVNTDRAVIERKCSEALSALGEIASNIFAAGPVNDAEGYRQADVAVRALENARFDMLIVCVAGWIPTHAVIRVIDHFRHKPMLLWGLCGWTEGARLISTADQAGATALSYTMREMGYQFNYVYSTVDKGAPVGEIEAFARACGAKAKLRDARIGTMGYRDMLLYGTMFDGLSLRREIGVEVEPFEMLEIHQAALALKPDELNEALSIAKSEFTFASECPEDALNLSARYALALSRRIRARGYDAITLTDVDGMKKLLSLPPAFVFNLIDRLCDVCAIPENDVMGSVTQLMVRYVTGQIAPYAEFYEFFEDGFLMGVPDFIPRECTLGAPVIQPAMFGALSTSLLNVSKYKCGLITLARLATAGGKYRLHLFKAQAKPPRAWEESGWAQPAPRLPSLEVKPECPMSEFAQKVCSQHIIMAYGDHIDALKQLCALLNVEVV